MTDNELKQHVQSALDGEPGVDANDIAVAVDEGVFTLRGTVASYSAKVAAGRVALRIYGTKGVANDLVVHVPGLFEKTDTEIALTAVTALKWSTLVPADRVTVTVANGHVTLNGNVDWQYQKDAALKAVRDLIGVRGVTNAIVVKPHAKSSDVRQQIEAALKRSAEVDARRINVTTEDGLVILSGNVHSWSEQRAVERAAWAAPGVTQVDDRLSIVP